MEVVVSCSDQFGVLRVFIVFYAAYSDFFNRVFAVESFIFFVGVEQEEDLSINVIPCVDKCQF